ncbi:hypothetical protein BC008_02840 [Mastigocoleus testarum BC008]|uniref:Uncharacterized protein n=1 Tax=Mastigocoleus testarum BC008 TaxID=371196 RepID=A0A0V7ZWN3_9CYAN|nr:hypothetical protein BC008_02840 [Mastigocoleus testarum BC008]
MTTKLKKFWKFFRNDIGELAKKPSSATETGAEVSKTSLELAIALGLLGSSFAPAAVAVAGLSFVGLASKGIKFYQDRTKDKLTLEECVAIASRLAYVESFERILCKIKDSNQNLFTKIVLTKIEKIQALEELGELTENFQFDPEEARIAITCFRETKLAHDLNRHLSFSLRQAGLTPIEADILTQRIAWSTQRYMNQALAEANLEIFHGMSERLLQELEKYQSIDDYLEYEISKQPQEKVFAEDFTFQDIYVPLKAQPLNSNGEEDKQQKPVNLEFWANNLLQNPQKANQVIFIQGDPGRGKSVFCRMFANWVRQNLYPVWTPVLVCLRDIEAFEKQFENTLRAVVDRDFANSDRGWLTDKNIRYLFLLDGFDELLMEGRTSGGLEKFLKQVGVFQESCQRNPEKGHRVLITGRTLALQSIERNMPANLERVKILPMDEDIQEQWFQKWSVQVGDDKATAFEQFLANQKCPTRVRELAQEPLLLYLLAAMHRDGELTEEMFAISKDTTYSVSTSKILIYQKSLDWVLTKQRPEILQREITEQDTEDLRYILTEAGLCVVQSGDECAAMSMIEKRLKGDETAKNFLEEARRHIGDNPLRNALAAFYLQPVRQTGSVEFAHKSFSEFLFSERLKENIESWTDPKANKKGRGFNIPQEQMDWEIYDLLGYGGLTPEIVEYLMGLVTASEHFRPVELFRRLEDFYQRWCDGEFIDDYAETLPQKKSRQLHEENIELGQRQVDIYAGLNVMILLLELHRYAQEQNDLKEQIIFYPSGQAKNNWTFKLRRIINYSDAIRFRTFNSVVGQYLSYADLRFVYLSSVDLRGVYLSGADLSSANLRRAYLSSADLTNIDLSNSDLSGANLVGANLVGANLIGANLVGANLIGANLSCANLVGAKLNSVDLSRANLMDADLSSANLSSANLIRTNFSRANLSIANLISVNLNSANLSSANLVSANLSRANLSSANLSSANLSRAKLINTNLISTDFSDADLSGADLSRAYLSRAYLSRAYLSDELFGDIHWDENTNWEGVRGLETTKNLPEALKQKLGLDILLKEDEN